MNSRPGSIEAYSAPMTKNMRKFGVLSGSAATCTPDEEQA
ncbi:MAG: hypothetical protein AVDCRST_MAG62-1078 [uncultured Sphingomonas sp.]|uniref:Uncharacterized protein n=1 Tax=uncultured Sphingomonas sp. TaxID=158754 RepID=A0A6J4TEB2_9SPHN|nr:MAG: hypothetical protein AVDCRST_MAG62-1078 [uncultured Sphingomonas sp.]